MSDDYKMNIHEVAEYLGCSVITIYKHNKCFDRCRIGRNTMYSRKSVEEYKMMHTMHAYEALDREAASILARADIRRKAKLRGKSHS